MDLLARLASGWLYAPASTAPTGYRGPLDLDGLEASVRRLRSVTPLPVVAGVGISTPALAAAVSPMVDGIVVGSPVLRALAADPGRLRRWWRSSRGRCAWRSSRCCRCEGAGGAGSREAAQASADGGRRLRRGP
ncbi:tryptophan synthase subunit alpha [Streptomyces albus]|nr:tryptophan synthase subunit alpha [Streptomyces albus]